MFRAQMVLLLAKIYRSGNRRCLLYHHPCIPLTTSSCVVIKYPCVVFKSLCPKANEIIRIGFPELAATVANVLLKPCRLISKVRALCDIYSVSADWVLDWKD